MNGKILLMLFAAILSFSLLGCRREGSTTKQGRAPSSGQTGAAKQGTQSGTTKTPGATPEAPSEVGKAPAGQTPGGTAGTTGQTSGTAGQASGTGTGTGDQAVAQQKP